MKLDLSQNTRYQVQNKNNSYLIYFSKPITAQVISISEYMLFTVVIYSLRDTSLTFLPLDFCKYQ